MKTRLATKKRFLSLLLVVLTVITMFPATTAFASQTNSRDSDPWGGLRIATQGPVTVYEDINFKEVKGTIYQYEGYTVIADIIRDYSDTNSLGFKVQYSTPKGIKTGYIKAEGWEYDGSPVGRTGLAKVKNTTNVYYGTSTTVNPVAGTVYAGEYVAFLAKNDDWAYIEYDSTSGRKRGYIYYGHLDVINREDNMPDLYTYQNPGVTHYVSGSYTVYAGPSSQYASIGSIANENITVLASVDMGSTDTYSIYIEYNVPGSAPRKGGFIVFDKYPALCRELKPYSIGPWGQ